MLSTPPHSTVTPYSYPGDAVSLLYRVRINGVEIPTAVTPDINPLEAGRIAAAYQQMPPYCWAEERFVTVHTAYAACAGSAEVEVRVTLPVSSFILHPKRRGLTGTLSDGILRFTVDTPDPRYFLVNFPGLPLLCILIDPPEEGAPGREDADGVDFGRFLAESKLDPAAAFERAVQAISGSGKTLYVPAGEYHCGQIHIRGAADCRIYLAPGALLRICTSPAGENHHMHGLWFDACENITLFGRGCLDHQGYENFAWGRNDYKHGLLSWAVPSALNPYTTQSPLFITQSRNLTLDGFTVRNARNFNVNIRRSSGITLRRCKVITPPASVPEFTDGYQINACQDILLENCFAFCNDDCIAAGHYFYSHDDCDSENFIARGFVGWNCRANGIRLGFYSHYNLGSFTFENCDMIGPDDSAVLIHALRDAPEAGRYQRYGVIRFKNCGFDLCERMVAGLITVEGARIDRLEFEDVGFDSPAPSASLIHGHPTDQIGELVFRRVCVGAALLGDLTAANLDVQAVGRLIVEK